MSRTSTTAKLAAIAAAALLELGCEKPEVLEQPKPLPSPAPVETQETTKLEEAVSSYLAAPSAESEAIAKKAMAELDLQIANLEQRLATTSGVERDEAELSLRNLKAARAKQQLRFDQARAGEKLESAAETAKEEAKEAGEKIKETAEKAGESLEKAAERVKENMP